MIKKLAAVIVLVMVASLSSAGCTSPFSSTPTPTPSDIAAMESYLGSLGYTVVGGFKYNSTLSSLYPTYEGKASPKGGGNASVLITKTGSRSDALSWFGKMAEISNNSDKSFFKFNSGYKNETYWQGNYSLGLSTWTDKVFVTDDNWVVAIGPYRTT
jgi:hypothetical protein